MASEKTPTTIHVTPFGLDAGAIPSGRPSSVFSRVSERSAASEHGPRSVWSQNAVRSTASAVTVASYLGNRPVRLFRHRRHHHHHHAVSTLNPAPPPPDTEILYPKTLAETERWLADAVAGGLRAPAEPDGLSSAVCLVFLDEDKCKREFPGFSLDRLYGHLRIDSWRPSHFQTTFCRFAVPLDVPMDSDSDSDSSGEPSRHHHWDWRFAVSHPFDWDLLWAYLPAARTTVGIARTWIEGYHGDFMDLESMVAGFAGPTLAHPTLVGLFALDILTRDAMAAVRLKGEQLWQAQKVTGYNHFPHQANKRLAMTDDDQRLARDISAQTAVVMGAAINLTAWIHVATQLAAFSAFVRAQGARFRDECPFADVVRDSNNNDKKKKNNHHRQPLPQAAAAFARLAAYVDQHALKQVGDLDGVHYDSSSWLDTARFLLQGVLNLAAQRDSAINIELAKDSRRIAEDSKRDSTSMMSLAIVSMFFLPGTYTGVSLDLPSPRSYDRGVADWLSRLSLPCLYSWTLPPTAASTPCGSTGS